MTAREPVAALPGSPLPAPRRTVREAALDRLCAAREAEGVRSNWMKRLQVTAVCLCLGVGALQDILFLQLLAIPAAVVCWWLDDRVARGEERLARLYEVVMAGSAEPPVMGDEIRAAEALPAPPSTPFLRVPGAGLHVMMLAVAILFNLM